MQLLTHLTLILSVGAVLIEATAPPQPHHQQQHGKPPNFIYIVSDDHDHTTATPTYMPETYKHLASRGRIYSHLYTPMSVCCPSRTGFWRSQHGHSHNITDVKLPFGGWDLFYDRGYQEDNLGVWLRKAGYRTAYTGKLMNGNTVANAQTKPVTDVFDESAILLDPYTYSYTNSSLSWNGGPPRAYSGNYSTDLVRDVGLTFLDEAVKKQREDQDGKPFFLGVAPIGPHSTIRQDIDNGGFSNPIPAQRHRHLYNDTIIPRTDNFNPDSPSGANFVRKLPKLNDTVIDYIDEWHRDRLRALRSVDELVGAIVRRAEELGILDNTYIVYTSDNGFSTGGQHRRPPSKSLGYEEDIRVPAFIRGPGIKAGSTSHETWSNIDLAASFAEIAGATEHAGYSLDGRIMDWAQNHHTHGHAAKQDSTHHLSEYWVENYPEGIFGGSPSTAKYKTLRLREHSSDDWAYTVWCNGERELYDMLKDPYQMNNLLDDVSEYGALNSTRKAHRIAKRLDALTLSLKRCAGEECRVLWRRLFPQGEVGNLEESLQAKYDGYFDALPRVHFDDCELGFFADKEQPDWSGQLRFGERA